MKPNHKLALYVAYYLSRFDKYAYRNLGYGTQKLTHEAVGKILDINPHTVKNMRDEFDPLHGNRAGWYQKSMTPSRAFVAKSLEDLDESQINEIVKDVLSEGGDPETKMQLINIASWEDTGSESGQFILRGVTGKKAEDFFVTYFDKTSKPAAGELKDMRDYGCGYDFEIRSDEDTFFVEVKGLAEFSGGILFTDKEWRTALKYGTSYYLALVNNLNDNPEITFINDPCQKLRAKRSVYTSVQIQWSVNKTSLHDVQ